MCPTALPDQRRPPALTLGRFNHYTPRCSPPPPCPNMLRHPNPRPRFTPARRLLNARDPLLPLPLPTPRACGGFGRVVVGVWLSTHKQGGGSERGAAGVYFGRRGRPRDSVRCAWGSVGVSGRTCATGVASPRGGGGTKARAHEAHASRTVSATSRRHACWRRRSMAIASRPCPGAGGRPCGVKGKGFHHACQCSMNRLGRRALPPSSLVSLRPRSTC